MLDIEELKQEVKQELEDSKETKKQKPTAKDQDIKPTTISSSTKLEPVQ
jgi:hypothetical protein